MPDPENELNPVDEIAEEFARRWRDGEKLSVEEYVERHPDLGDELRPVLAAVLMMEQLKPQLEDGVAASNRPVPSERTPVRIGEFRIVREIGRGGMGIVYEAYQETLGRRVALKLLAGHLLTDEKLRVRFRRESRAAARLHHTNIVPVFGVGESDGYFFYVMQFIQGRGLDQIIREALAKPGDSLPRELGDGSRTNAQPSSANPSNGASERSLTNVLDDPPAEPIWRQRSTGERDRTQASDCPTSKLKDREYCRQAARTAVQVADALAYSHSRGVLHRDVKPSNLLVDECGGVWVTDFGVAKLVEEANLTGSGELTGTLRYMAPERFSGQSDERGDVYSLGVTLYELLTLRPAYAETNLQRLILVIGLGAALRPRKLNPEIPPDLETIVLKAVAPDPAERYQTARELAEDLRRFLDDRPILARRSGPIERLRRWCRRNPPLALATATAFLLMVAITAISVIAYVRMEGASREVATANREMTSALASEKLQRENAENVSTLALEALNRTYEQFAPTRLVATPPTSNEEGIELPTQPALLPEAIPLLEELLRTYERIAASVGEFPGLQARAAEANHRIGDICQRLGRSEQAIGAYRRAIELYSRPLPGSDETAVRIKLARACNDLGRTLRSQQQLDEARKAHEQAIQTLTEAPESLTDRPEWRYELARTYFTLSQRDMFSGPPPGPDHARHGGDFSHGPPRFASDRPPHPGFGPQSAGEHPGRRAVVILEQLVKEYPTVPEYRHLLACCYRDTLPDRPGFGRQSTDAGSDRAVDLLRQLVAEFPKAPDYLFDLCETLGRPPRPPGRSGRPPDDGRSQERLREAIDRSTELVTRYPNVPAYAAAHVRYLSDLGRANWRSGKFDDAEKLQRRALTIQRRLVRQYPEVALYGVWLSMVERSLGQVLVSRGDLKEGRSRLESAASRAEALRVKDPQFRAVRPVLGMTYRDLARALDLSGETTLAAEALRKADEFAPDGGPGPFGPRDRGNSVR